LLLRELLAQVCPQARIHESCFPEQLAPRTAVSATASVAAAAAAATASSVTAYTSTQPPFLTATVAPAVVAAHSATTQAPLVSTAQTSMAPVASSGSRLSDEAPRCSTEEWLDMSSPGGASASGAPAGARPEEATSSRILGEASGPNSYGEEDDEDQLFLQRWTGLFSKGSPLVEGTAKGLLGDDLKLRRQAKVVWKKNHERPGHHKRYQQRRHGRQSTGEEPDADEEGAAPSLIPAMVDSNGRLWQ